MHRQRHSARAATSGNHTKHDLSLQRTVHLTKKLDISKLGYMNNTLQRLNKKLCLYCRGTALSAFDFTR